MGSKTVLLALVVITPPLVGEWHRLQAVATDSRDGVLMAATCEEPGESRPPSKAAAKPAPGGAAETDDDVKTRGGHPKDDTDKKSWDQSVGGRSQDDEERTHRGLPKDDTDKKWDQSVGGRSKDDPGKLDPAVGRGKSK